MKRLIFLVLLTGSAVLAVAAVGCQTYDFEPVTPLTWVQTTKYIKVNAKHFKPNLWLLVDSSGSMETNSDACTGGVCVKRIEALKAAMNDFLSGSGSVARMALTFFPAGKSCQPANAVARPLPDPTPDDTGHDADLAQRATEINTAIQAQQGNGGTPTGASVAFVGGQPGLLDANDGRDDFILLLTDGLPNCNDSNENNICGCQPNNCSTAQRDACRCTTGDSCNSARPGNCSNGCLDQAGAAAQIAAQKKKGIRTIVVGFGADVTKGDAPETLAAMAAAGGANLRDCPNGDECGADDTCVQATHLCARQYFKAGNRQELATDLAKISQAIVIGNACEFKLDDQPDSDQYIAVIFNGKDIPSSATSWTYTGGSVIFAEDSTYCNEIKARDSNTEVEIRYVSELKK